MLQAFYYTFPKYQDFAEVYVIVDIEKSRMHFSAVNLRYSATFDLAYPLSNQIPIINDLQLKEDFIVVFNTIVEDLAAKRVLTITYPHIIN